MRALVVTVGQKLVSRGSRVAFRPERELWGTAAAVTAAGVLVLMAGCQSVRPAVSPDKAPVSAARRAGHAVARATVRPVDPAEFSPGGCVAFAPTRGDRHQTVFLDAGHGGVDPGGVGVTETGAAVGEASVDLRIELDTAALLRARGYRVVVSRTRPATLIRLTPEMISGGLLTAAGVHDSVAARDVCANLARAAVLIGIYMNAGSGGAGCVTAYDPGRPFSADNRRLAGLLQRDVLAAMNAQGWDIPDGGVRPDTGMGSAVTSADEAYGRLMLLGPAKAGYFSTPSRMPGALIEPLFVTDPFEASRAVSGHGQHVIAAGIAEAVDQYFAHAPRRAG